MLPNRVALNRVLVGLLALGCGAAALGIAALRGIDDPIAAGFIRVGLALGALWCAMPSRTREAAWAHVSPYAVLVAVLAAVVLVRHLRVLLPVLAALAAIGYFVRPRRRRPVRSPLSSAGNAAHDRQRAGKLE